MSTSDENIFHPLIIVSFKEITDSYTVVNTWTLLFW